VLLRGLEEEGLLLKTSSSCAFAASGRSSLRSRATDDHSSPSANGLARDGLSVLHVPLSAARVLDEQARAPADQACSRGGRIVDRAMHAEHVPMETSRVGLDVFLPILRMIAAIGRCGLEDVLGRDAQDRGARTVVDTRRAFPRTGRP
jgi:hypothetical protein